MEIVKEFIPSLIILVGLLIAGRYVHLFVRAKQEELFQKYTTRDAVVRSKCQVCEGMIEEPGVAQIAGDRFIVHTMTGKHLDFSLKEVSLKSYPGKSIIHCNYPWFGKTVFEINAPGTWRFAIGVKEPDPWFDHFTIRK